MLRKQIRACTFATLACALCSTLLACTDKKERQPLPDWSNGYDIIPSDGGVDDARVIGVPPGGFGIVVPEEVEYPHRLFEEGTKDGPCAITLGNSHNDIRCIYDTDELDLFVLGFKLNVVTPKGGCDFVLYDPYLYESWPVGVGPTEVSYTVEEDGTFSHEVNSEKGVPVCDFDYSHSRSAGGPNCCLGSYTVTETSAKTGESSMARGNWGGELSSECFDGGGFLLKDGSFDSEGFPLDPIFFVDRAHQIIPIVEKGFSDKYRYTDNTVAPTNVQLANFWDPADRKLPLGLSEPRTHRDYTLVCLDDAQEVLGRIRFQVREWNEELQFDERGNPDSIGMELQFDSPVNDILDWKDIRDLSDSNWVLRAF